MMQCDGSCVYQGDMEETLVEMEDLCSAYKKWCEKAK